MRPNVGKKGANQQRVQRKKVFQKSEDFSEIQISKGNTMNNKNTQQNSQFFKPTEILILSMS